MRRNCTNCGKELKKNEKYCSNCNMIAMEDYKNCKDYEDYKDHEEMNYNLNRPISINGQNDNNARASKIIRFIFTIIFVSPVIIAILCFIAMLMVPTLNKKINENSGLNDNTEIISSEELDYNNISIIQDDNAEDNISSVENEFDNKEASINQDKVYQLYYTSNMYNYENSLIQDNININGTIISLNLFVTATYDKSKLVTSGSIMNPYYSNDIVNIETVYYNEEEKEIGRCNNSLKLLGEGYSSVAYSCVNTEDELLNNSSFDDVKFYKINIFK